MTTLTGTIYDSGGVTVSGLLQVTLAGSMVNDTTPKKLFVPKPKNYTVTNGVISGVTLEESETKLTTYYFEFFPLLSAAGVTPEVYDTANIKPFPFYAEVPNQAEVDITELVPTGMVNDVLATGSLRVARIIATNPNYAASFGFTAKGEWAFNITYKFNDIVTYNNRVFICKSLTPISGVIPVQESTDWFYLPVIPSGEVQIGDDTAYSSGWNGNQLAPTKNAVYDIVETKADKASPTFTGLVTVPTASTSDNSTQAASTAYVKAQLASTTLTGIPTAPTATVGTNTTQIATTAFVQGLLASPILTGDPKAPTPANYDNDTSIATTAFVQQLCRPAFLVTSSANQDFSVDGNVAIFNNEQLDTSNAFSGSIFTVPVAGTYLFGGAIYLSNLDASTRTLGLIIRVNGSDIRRLVDYSIPAGAGYSMPLGAVPISLNSGDLVTIKVTTFGVNFNYRIAGVVSYFWGFRLPI